MRLYIFLTFLIVCILAVNAAQQNQNSNKRNQLAKRKSSSGAVSSSNHLIKNKPRARPSAKSKKVRKVKPALARKPKKVVRRVVKKSNRRSGVPAKKIARKSNNRNSIRRGSRGGARKRLAKQELSDTTGQTENKSIGAGQANGADLDTSSGEKTQDAGSQAPVAKPVAAPVQPAVAQPVAAPAKPAAGDSTNLSASPSLGSNPLSSSPFNIPKSNGQNQAIGAAFSQSSNGGSAFAAGFASISNKQNTAGGYGQVNAGKNNPNSENLNNAEEPASSDTAVEEGSGELAAYRRRPHRG